MPGPSNRRSTFRRRLCARFPVLAALTSLFLYAICFRLQITEFLGILLDGGSAVPTTISQAESLTLNGSFTHLSVAYAEWDAHVGCSLFARNRTWSPRRNPSLQDPDAVSCASLRLRHVSVHVKEWRWLPGNLDNLYSCNCGLTCLWTKSEVLADDADAELYETGHPPRKRKQGEPLRVYMDLEPGRNSPTHKDIFVSYHAGDTVQATYAGASFHNHRSYYTSSVKKNDILVYWSSSNCVTARSMLARRLLAHLPHHSFGKCLNNGQYPSILVQIMWRTLCLHIRSLMDQSLRRSRVWQTMSKRWQRIQCFMRSFMLGGGAGLWDPTTKRGLSASILCHAAFVLLSAEMEESPSLLLTPSLAEEILLPDRT